MKKVCCTYLFLIFILVSAQAQITRKSHRKDRELSFNYENDLLFGTDQYYTSGVNIHYSRLINSTSRFYKLFSSRKSDSSKLITRYHYGHKIFTPSEIKEKSPEEFDRPYAGWHFIKFHIMNFPSKRVMNRYVTEIGLVGNVSGIGNFHQWWHSSVGIVRPRGWKYEIENELVTNFGYERVYQLPLVRRISLTSYSGFLLGNGQNRASQELTLLYGKHNALNNSGLVNSRLSYKKPIIGIKDSKEEEGFIFYSIRGMYVASNIFIEGSKLFENDNPYLKDRETFVIERKWGFIYTNNYTTFSFIIHRLSPEIIGGKVHRYLSLNLGFRF